MATKLELKGKFTSDNRVAISDTLPTPDESWYRKFLLLQDQNGDRLNICLKFADFYTWVELATTIQLENLKAEILEEQLITLAETGTINPVADENGTLYTDENGAIYVIDEPISIPECKIKTVNGAEPDEDGDVKIDIPECKIKTVNGAEPDEDGNVEINFPECAVQTVNGVEPDEDGNVTIDNTAILEDQIITLAKMDVANPTADENGSLYTDENDAIYIL